MCPCYTSGKLSSFPLDALEPEENVFETMRPFVPKPEQNVTKKLKPASETHELLNKVKEALKNSSAKAVFKARIQEGVNKRNQYNTILGATTILVTNLNNTAESVRAPGTARAKAGAKAGDRSVCKVNVLKMKNVHSVSPERKEKSKRSNQIVNRGAKILARYKAQPVVNEAAVKSFCHIKFVPPNANLSANKNERRGQGIKKLAKSIKMNKTKSNKLASFTISKKLMKGTFYTKTLHPDSPKKNLDIAALTERTHERNFPLDPVRISVRPTWTGGKSNRTHEDREESVPRMISTTRNQTCDSRYCVYITSL